MREEVAPGVTHTHKVQAAAQQAGALSFRPPRWPGWEGSSFPSPLMQTSCGTRLRGEEPGGSWRAGSHSPGLPPMPTLPQPKNPGARGRQQTGLGASSWYVCRGKIGRQQKAESHPLNPPLAPLAVGKGGKGSLSSREQAAKNKGLPLSPRPDSHPTQPWQGSRWKRGGNLVLGPEGGRGLQLSHVDKPTSSLCLPYFHPLPAVGSPGRKLSRALGEDQEERLPCNWTHLVEMANSPTLEKA
jgi:hypothetical protein